MAAAHSGYPDIHLDCCASPQSTVQTILDQDVHHHLLLRQCRCGQRWLERLQEIINWSGGEDDLTCWFSPLTAQEAAGIVQGQAAAFEVLRTRSSLVLLNNGEIRRVEGAPASRTALR